MFFALVRPKPVLLLVDRLIQAGKAWEYERESLAMSSVGRLVNLYLEENRELVIQDHECTKALVRIMDTFLSVGHPDAHRLSRKTRDFFR